MRVYTHMNPCECDMFEISFGLVIPHHLHFRRTEGETEKEWEKGRGKEKESKDTRNAIASSLSSAGCLSKNPDTLKSTMEQGIS